MDAGPRCGGQPRLLCLFLSLEERKKTDKTRTRTKLRNFFLKKKSQLDLSMLLVFVLVNCLFFFFLGGEEKRRKSCIVKIQRLNG